MAKDPAFLFYPGDWLGGTIGMSFEEKGAYMELLMMQFTRGHMTTDMIHHTVGQLWVKLQVKFVQDEHGLWYNPRLDAEKAKRQKFVESRKNNKKGTNQHKTTNHTVGHMTSHMENENRNENVIEIQKGVQGEEPEFADYQSWTDDIIAGNDWHFTGLLKNVVGSVNGHLKEYAQSHLSMLSRYPKMKPPDLPRFRQSLIGHINEKLKQENVTTTGQTTNRKQQHARNLAADYVKTYGSVFTGGPDGQSDGDAAVNH